MANSNSTLPDRFANLDWVSERAKCTPFTVFEVLRSQVEQDMDRRNALNAQLPAHKTFIFQSSGEWFAVVYQDSGMSRGVKFRVTPNGVIVRDVESQAPICKGNVSCEPGISTVNEPSRSRQVLAH
jgi:histidinol-phosphate/aromatic aminotransferase/cobyric acid decarboxylase-like protein